MLAALRPPTLLRYSSLSSLPDATDQGSIQECARKVGSHLASGGLNLLVNNAGVMFKEGILECKAEDMQTAFNTNVIGPMNIMKVIKHSK